jgi:hypothetical protein
LLEPQTTALNQFSESFDNAYWDKGNCTVTANQTASPSGYVDADLVLDNTSNNQHGITRNIAITSGNKYTASFFLKEAGYTTAAIRMGFGSLWTGGAGPTVEFNLVALTGNVVDGSGVTFTIEDYGNGWRRCSVTGTCVTSGNTVLSLYLKQYAGYIGSGTDGVYAWGANITATSYATSYIPTLSAASTRGQDACFKTGISSLIGQTEGTFFAEVDFTDTDADQMYLTLSDGTSNNRIHIGFNYTSNWLYCNIRSGGAAQGLITQSSPSAGIKKIAVGYKLNDYVLYINGVQVGVDTSALVPACSRLDVGGYFSAGFEYPVKQAILFPTRLTNTELADLTTI